MQAQSPSPSSIVLAGFGIGVAATIELDDESSLGARGIGEPLLIGLVLPKFPRSSEVVPATSHSPNVLQSVRARAPLPAVAWRGP